MSSRFEVRPGPGRVKRGHGYWKYFGLGMFAFNLGMASVGYFVNIDDQGAASVFTGIVLLLISAESFRRAFKARRAPEDSRP